METVYYFVAAFGGFIIGGWLGMRVGATIAQNQMEDMFKDLEDDPDKPDAK